MFRIDYDISIQSSHDSSNNVCDVNSDAANNANINSDATNNIDTNADTNNMINSVVTTTDNVQDIDPDSFNNDCNCDCDNNKDYPINDFDTHYSWNCSQNDGFDIHYDLNMVPINDYACS